MRLKTTAPRYVKLLAIGALALGLCTTSCTSKKKLAAEAAAKKKAAAQAAAKKKADAKKRTLAELNDLLNNPYGLSIEDRIKALQAIKAEGSNDSDILAKIREVEEAIKAEKEAAAAALEEPKSVFAEEAEKTESTDVRQDLLTNLGKIASLANSGKAQASNNIISSTLDLFESNTTDVLIIIGKKGGVVDYDKPTTISNYLNYIKDQKAFDLKIENILLNDSGKIKLLELAK